MKQRNESTNNRPLITFALFAYNQDQFIEKAVNAAFAQTYSPLEIILSDDCSDDKTFDIMTSMAKVYQGPHSVILNRNTENLGVGEHVNTIFCLARGDLIVAAAGDDISAPRRTERTVSRWIESGRPASLSAKVNLIDEAGRAITTKSVYKKNYTETPECRWQSLLLFAVSGQRNLLGCSSAWSPVLFQRFGPISNAIVNEDNVLAFRSWLIDRVLFLDDTLVEYRLHGKNLSHQSSFPSQVLAKVKENEKRLAESARRKVACIDQHLEDLRLAHRLGLVDSTLVHKVTTAFGARYERLRIIALWGDLSFAQRIQLLYKARKEGWRFCFSRFIRLFPPLFFFVRGTASRFWTSGVIF